MEEQEAVGRLLPKIGKEMVRPWKRRGGLQVWMGVRDRCVCNCVFVYGLCKDGEPEEEARRDCGVSDLWELVVSPLGDSLATCQSHVTSLADLEPAAPLVELLEAVTRIEGG